jgi:hypothetical protein
MIWSTLLGGSGSDYGLRVALDASGNVCVAGGTASADFPTTAGAFQRSFGGGTFDAFVTKLSPNGASLVLSSYLGGNQDEIAYAVVPEVSGNLVLAGYSGSSNFPTTPGVVKRTISRSFANACDGFVAKLDAAGSTLLYATFLGTDNADDAVCGLALDASGCPVAVGYTMSPNFPTTAGALDQSFGLITDGFVTKLNATATGYVFSTYLGGAGSEEARAVVVAADGSIYVAGGTGSSDFPFTSGAYQHGLNGGWDGFVAKLAPTGSSLAYCTALGGSGGDECYCLAVAPDGTACVAGLTQSGNFPTTSGAAQGSAGGGGDAFVAAISPSGGGLTYSSYLGGAAEDIGTGVAVSSSDKLVTVGYTSSTTFPTYLAFDASSNGASDGYVTEIDMGLGGAPAAVGDGQNPKPATMTASPNPFVSGTMLSFALARPGPVHVRIFDTQGRSVRVFAPVELSTGLHKLEWDGRDESGIESSPGRYFVEVRADQGRSVGTLTKLR